VILQANLAALALLRCDDPGKFIGQPGISWIAPHAIPALMALHRADPGGIAPMTFETVGVRFDGTEFPVRVQRSTIQLPDGPATVGAYTDLTDENRVNAERTALVEELRLSRHHLDEAQRIGHIGSWEQDYPTGPLWFSDESCRIFGLEPGAFAGTVDAFLAFVHHEDRAGVAPLLDPIPLNIQYRIVRADGSVRVIHDVGELVRDPDGVPLRFVGTLQDITDRVTVEAERARLASAVEQTADSIWMQDLDNIVTYVNPSFSRIYGYEPGEIVGLHARMVDSGVHSLKFFDDLWATARAGKTWTGSLINRRKDGTNFEVAAVISAVTDPAGQVIGYMQTDRDVTRERDLESAIGREARERQLIETALARIDSAATPEEIAASACAEIIGLSKVESAFVVILEPDDGWVLANEGRHAESIPTGTPVSAFRRDELRERARGGPWVAAWRPGRTDDAFLDLITSTGLHSTAYAPFQGPGDTIGVIGIVAYDAEGAARLVERLPALATFGSIVGTMVRPGLGVRRRAAADLTALQAIVGAAAFTPFFQPIVDLWDGSVVGHEALTRFGDGRPPNVVFAAAARAGYGIELETACLGASIEASAQLPAGTYLSLNVSPELVLSGSLALLLASLDRPVVLEITEHVAIDDYEGLRSELRQLGATVRLAVDDAGAGYASFRHILELAPDFVKIDLALVRGVDEEPARQALIAGMGYFATKRRLRLVAEGIETSAELDALRALAVPFGQGYLLGRPQSGVASGAWPTRIDLPAFPHS
jgi:PAS domain S-box-containing protein